MIELVKAVNTSRCFEQPETTSFIQLIELWNPGLSEYDCVNRTERILTEVYKTSTKTTAILARMEEEHRAEWGGNPLSPERINALISHDFISLHLLIFFKAFAMDNTQAREFFRSIRENPYKEQAKKVREWMVANFSLLQECKELCCANYSAYAQHSKVIYGTDSFRDQDSLDRERSVCCRIHECLTFLPFETVFFSNLTELDLSGNDLHSLPPDWQFSHLEVLNLSENSFTTLPAVISKSQSLKVLNLADNPIQGDLTLADLKALKVLNLSKTLLRGLPSGIEQLEELNMSYTLIEELPNSIVNLKMLRVLEIKECEIWQAFTAQVEDFVRSLDDYTGPLKRRRY